MKAFLVNKNVHKPWKGGIGSFVLTNLITAYLQRYAKERVNFETEEDSLGIHAHVLGFL